MQNNYLLYMHIAPNGKKYIGITSKSQNIRCANGAGYCNNKHFYNAIGKYGWDNFQHIVLADNLSKEWACKLEQDFIRDYQSNNPKYGYNHSSGGEFGMFGYKHTPETIEKIKKSNTGKKRSDETRHNISIGHIGIKSTRLRTVSELTKQKISNANKGKHRTENTKKQISETLRTYYLNNPKPKGLHHHSNETKLKMSLSHKNKKFSDEHKKHLGTPIILYKHNKKIAEFDKIKDCAEYLGVPYSYISEKIAGTRNPKKLKDYTFFRK